MRRALLFVLVLLCLAPCTFSQAPVSWTSADMYLALRKLNVLGSVLYIAAHPDDENTRLISYLSKDRMLRTGYLSLTRGDGGQNLIGNEQGIELGLIRTQELLSARRIDGGEQFFTRAYDFGFSKSPEETFTKWDREKILSDVVWVIRQFQPDVIITRFPTTGEGGHGHHTASAILAIEAFIDASDFGRFHDQVKYVQPWKPKRIVWNSFNFGGTNTTSPDQFKLDVGGYNPLLGKSYGEIAATSRSQHKSQGFGVPASRGEAIEFFKPLGGPPPVNDLFDDVDLSWNRVPGASHIPGIVDSLSSTFDLLHPERSVKGLVRLYQAIAALPAGYWRNQKLIETQQLIEQCSGLFLDATASEQFAVQTDSIRINFSFNNRLGANAIIRELRIDEFDSLLTRELAKNKNFNFSRTFFVPLSKQITQPYWLENKMEEGYFNVSNQLDIGRPDVAPSYWAQVTVNIEGQNFLFLKPVKYKFTDPVRGELYEPLVVIPPLVISPDESVKMTRDNNDFSGVLKIQAKKKNVSASMRQPVLFTADKIATHFEPRQFILADRNSITDVSYTIKAGKDNNYVLGAGADSIEFSKDMHEIKYDHIPYIDYFTDASVLNRKLDLKTYNKKIGYIIGAGDKVPDALEQMGYEVVLLTDKELSRIPLKQFDAIITGVRAYNTNEWMNRHYDKLMRYVNEGGNLIVQYNTSNNIGPVRARISPYPFDISRNRITDENAAVSFLKPDHPVLNFPNKITTDDFRGWVQERSIYHATKWDTAHFETVLAMNDPGEKSDSGSLIIARHGRGVFVYTGLVFFRELPAGVPGAYRLLANIIALNRKKAF